jgi:exopolysaccharide biosynthesis polyprenyl glycosylphosphotransferase
MKRFVKIIDYLSLFIFNRLMGINWLESLIISFMIFLAIYAFRVYDVENMKSMNETFIRTLAGSMVSFIGVSFFAIFFDYSIWYVFFWNLIFSIFYISILHKIEYHFYEKYAPEKRYLVIGRENEIGHILNEITKATNGKYKFLKFINPSPKPLLMIIDHDFEKPKNKGIFKYFNTKKLNSIVITDPKLEKLVSDEVEHFKKQGIKIEYLPNLTEKFLKRIPLEVFDRFREYYSVTFDGIYETPAKRVLDIFISSIALIILSPFMLLIALLIFIEDGKPIVFSQDRVGLDESIFEMHKFRSMKNKKNIEAKFATDEQDRVLKIGKIIRPSRLDEILQFYDILRGVMSFVGPRPEQVKFVEEYNKLIPSYYARHKLKSGLTGWAQIMYQYSSSLEETRIKLSYDLYYVKNRNLLMDLQIILKTFEAVFWKRGAI